MCQISDCLLDMTAWIGYRFSRTSLSILYFGVLPLIISVFQGSKRHLELGRLSYLLLPRAKYRLNAIK